MASALISGLQSTPGTAWRVARTCDGGSAFVLQDPDPMPHVIGFLRAARARRLDNLRSVS